MSKTLCAAMVVSSEMFVPDMMSSCRSSRMVESSSDSKTAVEAVGERKMDWLARSCLCNDPSADAA